VNWNGYSLVATLVENNGHFFKLKTIGLDQDLLYDTPINLVFLQQSLTKRNS